MAELITHLFGSLIVGALHLIWFNLEGRAHPAKRIVAGIALWLIAFFALTAGVIVGLEAAFGE